MQPTGLLHAIAYALVVQAVLSRPQSRFVAASAADSAGTGNTKLRGDVISYSTLDHPRSLVGKIFSRSAATCVYIGQYC